MFIKDTTILKSINFQEQFDISCMLWHIYLYVCMYAYMYIWLPVCTYVCKRACVSWCVYMYAQQCICKYTCGCLYDTSWTCQHLIANLSSDKCFAKCWQNTSTRTWTQNFHAHASKQSRTKQSIFFCWSSSVADLCRPSSRRGRVWGNHMLIGSLQGIVHSVLSRLH